MKQFFLRISIFLLIVLVGAWAIDFVISYRLRQNENRMYAGWNAMYQDTMKYDLVVNGGSCAWAHYSPIILDTILNINSFNLGIDGSSVNRHILKYENFSRLHQRPKYLIQNIDIGTMAITHGYEREQFFPYFFYDRELINAFDKYEQFTFAEKYLPCYRYLGYDEVLLEALFRDNKKHYIEKLTKGYYGREYVWDASELNKMDSITISIDSIAVDLFIEFLEVETSKGVQILLVYSPVYSGVVDKMTNQEEMQQMYSHIAEQFSIPILDYTTMAICNDTNYFYNGTHLNKKGAELFTTQLAHDIDSLGLLK